MDVRPRTALASCALFLGIFAVGLALFPFLGLLAVFPGVPAAGLGYAARTRATVQGGAGRGRGTAAMWLGGIATVLGALQAIAL